MGRSLKLPPSHAISEAEIPRLEIVRAFTPGRNMGNEDRETRASLFMSGTRLQGFHVGVAAAPPVLSLLGAERGKLGPGGAGRLGVGKCNKARNRSPGDCGGPRPGQQGLGRVGALQSEQPRASTGAESVGEV